MFSFSKGQRFKQPVAKYCQSNPCSPLRTDCFYGFKSTITRRAAGFGYGTKYDFTKDVRDVALLPIRIIRCRPLMRTRSRIAARRTSHTERAPISASGDRFHSAVILIYSQGNGEHGYIRLPQAGQGRCRYSLDLLPYYLAELGSYTLPNQRSSISYSMRSRTAFSNPFTS